VNAEIVDVARRLDGSSESTSDDVEEAES